MYSSKVECVRVCVCVAVFRERRESSLYYFIGHFPAGSSSWYNMGGIKTKKKLAR